MVNSVTNPIGLKVGVIGVGNGGGQAAMAAARHGHRVFVINTSDKDLDDQVLAKEIKGHRVGDGRGSGKSRENAVALLTQNGNEEILEIFNNPNFKTVVEPCDIVVVLFSTGGGTGSGIGPVIADMVHKAYKHKVVIPYGILPKNSESVVAQANTIACVDEMVDVGTSYMLADLDYYANESQEEAFRHIGEYIAETLNVLRGDYLGLSANGMADERDVLTVISEPGYMTIHFCNGLTEPQLANKTLQGYLIDKIKSSPACRTQRDKMVQYNLIITNCSSAISDPLKVGDYTELNGYVGEPKATYSNYSVDDARFDVQVIAVTSGLTVPIDRFAAARAKVKENKERYERASALNLKGIREDTTIGKKADTTDIIMGSQKAGGPDLSFLKK